MFSNWVLLVLLGFEPLLLRGGDLRKDTQELGARNCEGVGLLQARDVKVARPKPAEKELQANGRNSMRLAIWKPKPANVFNFLQVHSFRRNWNHSPKSRKAFGSRAPSSLSAYLAEIVWGKGVKCRTLLCST